MDDKKLTDQILKRDDALLAERKPWEDGVWKSVSDYVLPGRDMDLYKKEGKSKRGKKKGSLIFDDSPGQYLEQWSDGMQGHLVSMNFPWLRMMMADQELDQEDVVREWLDMVDAVMYAELARSNFYDQLPQYFMDAGGFGTVGLAVDWDLAREKLCYTAIHPMEFCVDEDEYGWVETIYHRLCLSARKAHRLLGDAVLENTALKKSLADSPFDEYWFLHAVEPREGRDRKKLDSLNMPYGSYYVDLQTRKMIKKSGYDTFPIPVWRVRKNTGEKYGRSPSTDGIHDIVMLNAMMKTVLIAGQRAVQPPWLADYNLKGRISLSPDAISYKDAPGDDMKVLQSPTAGFPITFEQIDQLRSRIRARFKIDYFQMFNQLEREVTAREVIERVGEKAVNTAPLVGRYKGECLDPVIDRTFSILLKMDKIPPPPEEIDLSGEMIKVDYLGPLSQVQKRYFESQGVLRGLDAGTLVIQLDQTVMDYVDTDEAFLNLIKSQGMPQSVIRSPEKVEAMRQARLEAEMRMMQAEQAAKMLTQSPNQTPEPGSVTEELMTNETAPAFTQ